MFYQQKGLFCRVSIVSVLSFFWVECARNIVLPLKQINRVVSLTFYQLIMYLLIHPSASAPYSPKAAPQLTRSFSVGIDFVTPDGTLVPRALGEAALRGRTAVLVGGLLVGVWPQS